MTYVHKCSHIRKTDNKETLLVPAIHTDDLSLRREAFINRVVNKRKLITYQLHLPVHTKKIRLNMPLFLDKDGQFTIQKKMAAVHFTRIALDTPLKTVLYRPEN